MVQDQYALSSFLAASNFSRGISWTRLYHVTQLDIFNEKSKRIFSHKESFSPGLDVSLILNAIIH